MVDLGTLGGAEGHAHAVNEHGQVVGYAYTAGNAALHAFSWTPNDGMIDLGTAPARRASRSP
jgi:probable HAF family extracellular repeat protein